MTVFLLGPSEWRGKAPFSIPPWVRDLMPATWHRAKGDPFRPVDLRAALAEACRNVGKRAVLMEATPRQPRERHTALFRRIEQTEDVDQHFIIWPPACKRSGLDIEIGNLLTRLEQGEPLDIRIFHHTEAANIHEGEFISLEKGNRSRYYADLYEYGALIIPWENLGALFTAVTHAAGSLR